MKTVVIDARLAGLKHAGIGRYVEMLSRHSESKIKNLKFKIIFIKPGIKHYTISEQIKMPFALAKEKPDLVHFPHFNVPLLYNKPFVVTIHDLLWHEHVGTTATTLPAWIYWLKYVAYRLVLRHAVLKSRGIIVPSKWVKEQVIKRFPQVREKIHVIYEGVTEAFKGLAFLWQGQAFLDRYGLEAGKFLVYTGSLYPHKNVEVILNDLNHLTGLKLVVACSRNVFWEKFRQVIEKRGLENKVILAGFVPDEDLAVLYRKALALVMPSKSEGFGLPGLEAMAAGCPVISSNAGALPEIYGEAALYFDPLSHDGLLENIHKLTEDESLRAELIEKGFVRCKRYSWDKTAKETMEVYARCLGL